tara:strand:+ start:948 stop:2369 length:1422 start_codon:yes stop_codon:yes gene_type:complete
MKFIFLVFSLMLSGYAASDTTEYLRMKLFKQLNHTDWNFFTKVSSGRISNCLVTEISSIGAAYNLITNLISSLIIVIIYLIILLLTAPIITVVALTMSIIMVVILRFIIVLTKTSTKNHVQEMNSFMSEINENLVLLKSIKAMAIEKKFLSILLKTFKNLKLIQRKIIFLMGSLQILLEPIFVFFLLFLIYMIKIFSPEILVSTQFIFLIIIFYRIFSKVSSIQVFIQKLSNGQVYFESYNKLLNDAKKQTQKIEGIKKIENLQSIEFKDVCFKYNKREILNKLSFKIKSKKIISITGPTGIGKTTILDLISSLYTPDSGEILVNGNSLLDIKGWRNKIGYVGQDSILMNDTILNNITFRDESISSRKVDEVIKLSSLQGMIKNSPEGLSTIAGERGINLSGGQKQRISLARALLREPFLLLMDEPTSALDKETKTSLLSNLTKIKKKITIICITHDQEVIKISDSVITIKKS